MKLLVHLAAACCLLFISCKKESQPETTTEKDANARVIYQLSTTERSGQLSVNAPSENAGLYTTNRVIPSVTWTAGSASVSEIRFKAKAWRNDDDDDDNNGNPHLEFHSRVPQTIDLFSALPTLGFLAIPPGNYHKIELKIKFEPLAGHPAFALKGNYVNEAGNIIPIDFAINQPFEIKFELKAKEKLDANIDYNALNELALNLLTNGISARDFRNAIRDNNGRLSINANKNGAMFKAMWNNFKVMLKVKMKKK
jgi:hypothetical protein